MALLALAATAVLGALAAAVLAGRIAAPLDTLVDVHAMLGIGGGWLCLLGAVASTTMPMFQGTAAVPTHALRAWLLATACLLAAGVLARLCGAPAWLPALALSLPALAFAMAVLWLQWRAPHRRNPSLVRFWRAGSVTLVLAGVALCAAASGAVPGAAMAAGLLAIGIGVPLLVNGMLLEIVGFITWAALRARCPRGVRIPAVGRLMPDADKHRSLCAHLGAAASLLAALAWPRLGPFAGLALAAAYAFSGACMVRCLRRAQAFAQEHGSGPRRPAAGSPPA
jgi:hypothetical protein